MDKVYNKKPGLKNWTSGALERRPAQYKKYLKLVCPEYKDWHNKTIADIGCGPIGGVLPLLPKDNQRIPVDPMADEWSKLHKPEIEIVEGFGEDIPIEDNMCDIVFCMNAIDHMLCPCGFADELKRILKPGGKLYLYTNLRTSDQVDEGHPIALNKEQVLYWLRDMTNIKYKLYNIDPTNDSLYRTIFIESVK